MPFSTWLITVESSFSFGPLVQISSKSKLQKRKVSNLNHQNNGQFEKYKKREVDHDN